MDDQVGIRRRSYFAYEEGAAAFDDALTRKLGELRTSMVAEYLPPENAHRFRHGGEWSSPANAASVESGMRTHSATLETRFDDLVANDLSLLDRSLTEVSNVMHKQFADLLFSTVSKAAEDSGNSLSAGANGPSVEDFLTSMENIEWTAERDGTVVMPSIYASPEFAVRMKIALDRASPEDQQRLKELKARKTAAALERETARKAKFIRYGRDSCAS